MKTEMDLKKAKQLYAQICEVLDDVNMGCEIIGREDDLVVFVLAKRRGTDDAVHIAVDPKRMLIRVYATPTWEFCREKRLDAALAICSLNDKMADGCFSYDAADGSFFFRTAVSYRESLIGDDTIRHLYFLADRMVKKYSPKLRQLDKGEISVEEFLETI